MDATAATRGARGRAARQRALLPLFLALALRAPGLQAAERAPGKFIPTAALAYGSASAKAIPPADLAKFDMVIASDHRERAWSEEGRNSWETLKRYNPNVVVVVYNKGPGMYNTASYGRVGDWEWILANHGPDKPLAERWVCRGIRSAKPLCTAGYRHERLMNLGNADWVNYQWQHIYQEFWGSGRNKGADGVFADNFFYQPPAQNGTLEAETDIPDRPTEYYRDGAYDTAKWQRDYQAAMALIIPGFASKPERPLYVPNFGYMHAHPEWWLELDRSAHRPFAAMEEAGIVQQYGGGLRSYGWDSKIATMSKLKNMAVVFANHGGGLTGSGLARMDSVDTKGIMGPGTTGWDGLWFGMTSFLMALNEERSNGYFLFTVWGYSEPHWLDEFDPAYIHLGRPLGDYTVRDGVAFREYEDGWVVANKTYESNRTGIPVPGGGQARVINHANFKNAESAPLVSAFDLPYYRGVILLKPGRKLGNADNR